MRAHRWMGSPADGVGTLVRLLVRPLVPPAAVRLPLRDTERLYRDAEGLSRDVERLSEDHVEAERPVPGRAEDLALDVIVVLGAPLGQDGQLGRVVRERVEAGVAAWKAGLAPWLLFTGGRTDPSVWADLRAGIYGAQARERSGVAEAAGMRDHARALGVPAEAILLEERARSTEENARYAASMMAERGLRRALVVTQPFHLRRSLRWFAREGVEVVGLHLEESYIYSGGWSSVGALYWVTREYVILTGEQVGRRLRLGAGA
jgi:uncharacterized SAM-binding protein YcdF (DUF218 family)